MVGFRFLANIKWDKVTRFSAGEERERKILNMAYNPTHTEVRMRLCYYQ
jgi:hypothetical protein